MPAGGTGGDRGDPRFSTQRGPQQNPVARSTRQTSKPRAWLSTHVLLATRAEDLSSARAVSSTRGLFHGASRRLARLSPVGVRTWLLTAFAEHLKFCRWLDTR